MSNRRGKTNRMLAPFALDRDYEAMRLLAEIDGAVAQVAQLVTDTAASHAQSASVRPGRPKRRR